MGYFGRLWDIAYLPNQASFIWDFVKAFDTSPYKLLKGTFLSYGIGGKTVKCVTKAEPSHSKPRQWKSMLIHQCWFTALYTQHLLDSQSFESFFSFFWNVLSSNRWEHPHYVVQMSLKYLHIIKEYPPPSEYVHT